MRLRTQFIVTMLLFGLILAVIAISAIITSKKVEETGRQERMAANIAQGAGELGYLANDFLIYRESPQLKRWQSRFASFTAEMAALQVDQPAQQALVVNLQDGKNRFKEVFDNAAAALGNPFRKLGSARTRLFFRFPGAGWRSNPKGWWRTLRGCPGYCANRGIGLLKPEPG